MVLINIKYIKQKDELSLHIIVIKIIRRAENIKSKNKWSKYGVSVSGNPQDQDTFEKKY